VTLNHQSQYDPGCSAITRQSGCTWTSGANGIYATTGGRHDPTPDQIHALVKRTEETNPQTPGWSLADLAKAMGRYGVGFVDHGGKGWTALISQLKSGHYVALQGDSDQFGNATCSGAFDGDHCVGIWPRSKVENRVTWWWIDDPICPTGRWERGTVLRKYAEKLRPTIQFGAFLNPVPAPSSVWKWTCRPNPPATVRGFRQFHLDTKGRIIGATMRQTEGMNVPCTAPKVYQGLGQPDRALVRLILLNRPRNGWLVSADFAHKEEG